MSRWKCNSTFGSLPTTRMPHHGRNSRNVKTPRISSLKFPAKKIEMHERQKIPEEVLMRRVRFKAEPTDPCFAERSKRKKTKRRRIDFRVGRCHPKNWSSRTHWQSPCSPSETDSSGKQHNSGLTPRRGGLAHWECFSRQSRFFRPFHERPY